ncbi:nitroreductase [Amycolatopsis sp. DSM 110486]|uniref:Acg family FMN-binding oxidoreductase n=1 Tax=Amycolatopsis sp. DSM 110486 TaxID=2865832 RepID=UPI001C6A7346|nr:nitroreductase [Amycolatopsis sp. DSM 110486]QYN18659.1 nitroreductase [Amycolatopsis sp. DSM 110486]
MTSEADPAPGPRGGAWTGAEVEVLGRAVLRAPSVHNTQPWTVEPVGRAVVLRERTDVALPRHDPDRRDLVMSCGAALANLELAVRVLGRRADVTILPDTAHPEVVARIDATVPAQPSDADLRRFSATTTRRSQRARFTGTPVGRRLAEQVARAAVTTGAQAVPLPDAGELAALFDHAARAIRDDGAYQREIALWTIRDEASHRHGAGLGRTVVPGGEFPWAGLVRRTTDLPELPVLRSRLAGETFLLFLTTDDGRADHVHAGYALEQCWLEAIARGLAVAVLTQPLHVPEVRSALCEDRGLPGFPQALMRLGRTSRIAPPSVRRGLGEVLIGQRGSES